MAWICGYQTSFTRRPPNGGLISKPHCNDINNEWHLISKWPHVSPLTKKSRSPNVCSRDDVWRTQKAFLGRPLTCSLESLATCPGGMRGAKGGTIPRASNHHGVAEWLRGCWKVPTVSQVLSFKCSTFPSERPLVPTWGRQTFFLLRAPSNLVTPLEVATKFTPLIGKAKRTQSVLTA